MFPAILGPSRNEIYICIYFMYVFICTYIYIFFGSSMFLLLTTASVSKRYLCKTFHLSLPGVKKKFCFVGFFQSLNGKIPPTQLTPNIGFFSTSPHAIKMFKKKVAASWLHPPKPKKPSKKTNVSPKRLS